MDHDMEMAAKRGPWGRGAPQRDRPTFSSFLSSAQPLYGNALDTAGSAFGELTSATTLVHHRQASAAGRSRYSIPGQPWPMTG